MSNYYFLEEVVQVFSMDWSYYVILEFKQYFFKTYLL